MDGKEKPVPHIHVTVEYAGDKVEHWGAHFIDGIKFLADCEALIRRNMNLNTSVDESTTVICKQNLKALMDRNKQ